MIADFVIRRYWQNPQSLSCQANNIETAKERSILVKFGKNEHPWLLYIVRLFVLYMF